MNSLTIIILSTLDNSLYVKKSHLQRKNKKMRFSSNSTRKKGNQRKLKHRNEEEKNKSKKNSLKLQFIIFSSEFSQ